ncbi:MAG: hypothetical protein WB676_25960 [Bryobacteraceae bacterium]
MSYLLRCAIWAVLAGIPAFAAMQRAQYAGTLGQSRIGMTIEVGMGEAARGHYFYQKYLTDIPLSVSQNAGSLTLKEQGGGTFHLHFKGNGSEGSEPLYFKNSVGLEGTWTSANGTQTFPVSLALQTVIPGMEGERRYAYVTKESDAAFETRVQAFYRAVMAGDRAAAAKYVSYPLRVNGKTQKTLKTPAEFVAAWDTIFIPAYLARLSKDLPHDMFVHEGMAMLGDGDVWFDDKGAAALNVP